MKIILLAMFLTACTPHVPIKEPVVQVPKVVKPTPKPVRHPWSWQS